MTDLVRFAIPLMRGKHKSKSIEDLVKENKEFVAANGVKELILIAQDLTYYGLDLYRERKLAVLLTALSEVEGIDWIRLHYAFPTVISRGCFRSYSIKFKSVSLYDIPLQHISDSVLKSMRRGTTRVKTDALLKKFREEVQEWQSELL